MPKKKRPRLGESTSNYTPKGKKGWVMLIAYNFEFYNIEWQN